MMHDSDSELKILQPYDRREVATSAEIEKRWRKSAATVRRTAAAYGLGRKLPGCGWEYSRPAFAMFLSGDVQALMAYHGGDRTGPLVRPYFERSGIDPETLGIWTPSNGETV